METVKIVINGKECIAAKNSTILSAAAENGIHIPTLCYLKELDPRANCRMCVVEVEGMRTLQPSCATQVREGMVIHTDSPLVREARKLTLQLILSRHAVDCHHCMRLGNSRCDDLDPEFCEMCFFCDCVRDGFCELQALAREYKVDKLPFEIEDCRYEIDISLDSVIRNPNKCVKCRRCVDVCDKVQSVHNLCVINRGSEVKIAPAMNKSMADSICVRCGKCAEVCPTGAIFMQEHKDQLVYYAHEYETLTAMQISEEGIRKLEKIMKKEEGTYTAEMIAGSLKKIGIKRIVTDDYAYARSCRQAEELLDKMLKKKPAILTNSFAAKNFLHNEYSDLKGHFAFYDSVQTIFDKTVREKYDSEEKIRTFCLTGNNENAAEAKETENVDIAVNARELYRIFQRTGAEPNPKRTARLTVLGDGNYDGKYGELFQRVLWTMEKELQKLELSVSRKTLKAVICTNLNQARQILDEIRDGSTDYDIVRIIG